MGKLGHFGLPPQLTIKFQGEDINLEASFSLNKTDAVNVIKLYTGKWAATVFIGTFQYVSKEAYTWLYIV